VPKKIVCLFNSFVGISGGDLRFVEIFVRIKSLNKIVITPLLGQKLCESKKLDALYIQTTKESHFQNIFLTYFIRILKALSLNMRIGADIIYSTSDFLPDVLPSFLYKRKNKNAKWVQVIHHVIPSKREGSHLTNVISFCAQRASFFLIKRYSDMIITVSSTVKGNLKDLGFTENKIKVNSNGVDASYFEKIVPDKGTSNDGVFIGRLHPSKGIFDLVRIWKIVCKRKPAKLSIIGDGDQRIKQALNTEIKNHGLSGNIDILGYVDSDQAFQLIRSSKVFVFPSCEEGFGIAILEAMACGLPIVAYSLPVYREVFGNKLVIVPPGDVNSMAKQILYLLENPQVASKMGEANRKFARVYDWNIVAERELVAIKCAQGGANNAAVF